MQTQADKNNELLKKILEMLERQRKDIQIIKQDIASIKKKIPEHPWGCSGATDVAPEPEKISTGWLW